jgi:hypothetical protein
MATSVYVWPKKGNENPSGIVRESSSAREIVWSVGSKVESQASPLPSRSESFWSGFDVVGQLSRTSGMPS